MIDSVEDDKTASWFATPDRLERSLILAVLIASGVPSRDRADVEQQVLMGAWRSVRRGMYRPDPAEDARKALRKWPYGIAWRKTGHYINSAWCAAPFSPRNRSAGCTSPSGRA